MIHNIVRVVAPAIAVVAVSAALSSSPAAAATVEVSRVHPTTSNGVTDRKMTLVKYYNGAGRYRVCLTSFHDPTHVGEFTDTISWQGMFSQSMPLPAEGKTNCTVWRARHLLEFDVHYRYGLHTWDGDIY